MAVSLKTLDLARTILALVVLAAIGWQLALHVGASYSPLNFFSYFTNLANLFAVFVLLRITFQRDRGARDFLRYLSAVNMATVGLVFAVLLRNTDLGALLPWVNVVLHYVAPLAIFADWLVAPSTERVNPGRVLFILVFPAVYLLYTLVRGAGTGWYPYPFLNPLNVGGYGAVAAYSMAITVTFLLVGWALLFVGNRSTRLRPR